MCVYDLTSHALNVISFQTNLSDQSYNMIYHLVALNYCFNHTSNITKSWGWYALLSHKQTAPVLTWKCTEKSFHGSNSPLFWNPQKSEKNYFGPKAHLSDHPITSKNKYLLLQMYNLNWKSTWRARTSTKAECQMQFFHIQRKKKFVYPPPLVRSAPK